MEELDELTIVWDEKVGAFTTFQTYTPSSGLSINNRHITFSANPYEHNRDDVPRGTFYGDKQPSEITVVFNDDPSSVKEFKTLGYEGKGSWTATISTDQESTVLNDNAIPIERSVASTINPSDFMSIEGKFFSDIKGMYSNFGTPDLSKLSAISIGPMTFDSIGTLTSAVALPNINAEVTVNLVDYPGDRLWYYSRTSNDGDPLTYGTELMYAGEITDITNNTITFGAVITPGTPTPLVGGIKVPTNLLDPSLIRVNYSGGSYRVFKNISANNVVTRFSEFGSSIDITVWEEQNTQDLDGNIIQYQIPSIGAVKTDDFFIAVKDEGVEEAGLKGFFSVVKFSTNDVDRAELFSINSNTFISTQ